VLEERASLSAGNWGTNSMSLYSGVGTETTTFLQLKIVPSIVVTWVLVAFCDIVLTGDFRSTVPGFMAAWRPLEKDWVPIKFVKYLKILTKEQEHPEIKT